jgi:type VI secretion system VasD/TssJ family lipoprotein
VQAIGVVALYRDVDRAQWRADAPVASSGPTKLALNVGKLAITLRPTA